MISDVAILYFYIYNNKKYYFFGEKHNATNSNCEYKYNIPCVDNCISIKTLLPNWINYNNNNNIYTDVYIELAYRSVKKPQTLSTRPILVVDELLCNTYEYIKYEYIDIRSYGDIRDIDPFLFETASMYFINTVSRRPKKYLLDFRQDLILLINLMIINYKDFVNAIVEPDGYQLLIKKWKYYIFNNPDVNYIFHLKLKHLKLLTIKYNNNCVHQVANKIIELSNINKNLTTLIYKFINYVSINTINNIVQDLNSTPVLVFGTKNITKNQLICNINNIFNWVKNSFLPLSAISMDTLLLCKLFLPSCSDEIIVFTGYQHIQNYVLFFNNYLGIKPVLEYPYKLNNTCIVLL